MIDDKPTGDAQRATRLKPKREADAGGLKTLLPLQKQMEMRRFRGKLKWKGALDAIRNDR